MVLLYCETMKTKIVFFSLDSPESNDHKGFFHLITFFSLPTPKPFASVDYFFTRGIASPSVFITTVEVSKSNLSPGIGASIIKAFILSVSLEHLEKRIPCISVCIQVVAVGRTRHALCIIHHVIGSLSDSTLGSLIVYRDTARPSKT